MNKIGKTITAVLAAAFSLPWIIFVIGALILLIIALLNGGNILPTTN